MALLFLACRYAVLTVASMQAAYIHMMTMQHLARLLTCC